ncbi:MAG: hypothetical protein HFG54_02635 [Lachnospiraceae bacterium]|nr:hypothetical protein [Lachnospiraceae bacterium]
MEQGMFIHSWDIDTDIDQLIEHFISLNCNAVAVNVTYHHAGVADLRLGHMHYRKEAGTAFTVRPSDYGTICPVAQGKLEEKYTWLQESCCQNHISLKAWVVNSHNSTLGRKYPFATVVNAWGDSYDNSLCINNQDFREYDRNLINNIERVVNPDSYVMEAMQWMPSFHGHHHEFMLGRLTPAIRYLLSLCFCKSCKEKAGGEGIDGEAVERQVQMLLKKLLKEDTTYGINEETQLSHIWMEYPLIYAYQQFRMRSVVSLVKETAKQVHSFGKKYEYIPSSTPFDINATWYEAGSFGSLEGIVDGFMPLIYHTESSYKKVLSNIRLFNSATPVGMGLNLGRDKYQGKADFISRIQEGKAMGCSEILTYNYGMATEEMLAWMKEAYQ